MQDGPEPRAFTLYKTAGRHAAPTLMFDLLPEVPSTREAAETMLCPSEHHLRVEIWER
jgi:hypothetical protein